MKEALPECFFVPCDPEYAVAELAEVPRTIQESVLHQFLSTAEGRAELLAAFIKPSDQLAFRLARTKVPKELWPLSSARIKQILYLFHRCDGTEIYDEIKRAKLIRIVQELRIATPIHFNV